MNRFSSIRIFNEANSIVAAWSREYATFLIKKDNLDRDSKAYADQFICGYNLINAHKVTLEIWRRYRHVLPAKGDVKTANIKRMINAVRRHIAQAKKARTNINKAVKGISVAFSRDII